VLITITHDVNAALSNFSNVLALADHSVFFSGTTRDFRLKGPEILEKVFSLQFTEEKYGDAGKSFLLPREISA
jgi:ABC-type cobalamin/Fe3+-siderophores transport system ATPase subunit